MKTLNEIKKKPLFKISAFMLVLVMMLSTIIFVISFVIDYFSIGDALINLVILTAIVVNFAQDK
jgi:hypothetical protein